MTTEPLILRLIKHIPEKHFRMVRYFGFLANRVVGKLLPQVRKALGQDEVKKAARKRRADTGAGWPICRNMN